MHIPKVIVIGLDGITPTLLEKWCDSGDLPNLKKIIEHGAYGRLKSTIPPTSATAWTSAVTGRNPGKTGIYSFYNRNTQKNHFELANTNRLRGMTILDILSSTGRSVAAINIPVTYPPRPINGFVITSIMTPNQEAGYTYPDDLKKTLEEKYNYLIHPMHGAYTLDEKLDRLHKSIDVRRDVLFDYVEQFGSELAWIVFTESDRIQHYFWAHMDDKHPYHDSNTKRKYRDAIKSIYKHLDTAVGEIIERYGEETSYIILSDHGFTGVAKYYYPNAWLKANGYLDAQSVRDTVSLKAIVKRMLKKMGVLTPVLLVRRKIFPPKTKVEQNIPAFKGNWEKTKAFYDIDDGIRINLKGREPYGVVEPGEEYNQLLSDIKEGLLNAVDPETGEPFLADVYIRDEIYSGPMIEDAPDLLLLPKQEEDYRHRYAGVVSVRTDQLIGPPLNPEISGTHSLYGIVMAYGNKVNRKISINDASIVDITPTALAILGEAIPDDIDGKVLTELIKQDWLISNPIKYKPVEEYEPLYRDVYAGEDEALIRERLRDLGYIE